MTKSQDNAAVVLRKQNKTKHHRSNFSYTSVSRLHVSHLSIIYRRPQRAVAELVLAGGSKLGSRRRGGSRRSVTVGLLVLMESRRAGGGGGSCYSVLVVVEDSLAGPLLPRACDVSVRDAGPLAATSPSLGMWSQNLFSGFFMDGAVELTHNFSQSPSWMVVVVGGAGEVFSLLTLEDQAAKHLGGCQESPRPWPRPLVDGERHENSWTPGSSGQFPRGFPSWSGSIGLHVWQCGGAVATLEMLESQAGWGDKIQPHPWVPRPVPPRPSRNWGVCPTGDRKAHGHRPRDDRGPVHFLWTWTLAYSE